LLISVRLAIIGGNIAPDSSGNDRILGTSFGGSYNPMIERTLIIVKPDAVIRNIAGKVLTKFEDGGLKVLAARMLHLSRSQAEAFYEVHRGRPFYDSLCNYMVSAPCMPVVLEGENAILRGREIMGATDPAEAAPGTIRKDLAESKERNSVHGSDSPESAAKEIPFFFPSIAICPRDR
jgi:nucleoside-diphosphate kinase